MVCIFHYSYNKGKGAVKKNIMESVMPLKFTSRIIWTVNENRGSVSADRKGHTEPPGPACGLHFPVGFPIQDDTLCMVSILW